VSTSAADPSPEDWPLPIARSQPAILPGWDADGFDRSKPPRTALTFPDSATRAARSHDISRLIRYPRVIRKRADVAFCAAAPGLL